MNTESTDRENGSTDSSPESKPERPPEPEESARPGAAKPDETLSPGSKTTESNQAPTRRGGVLALLAFVFSIAALAGTGWIWWQDRVAVDPQEQRVAGALSRLENADGELAQKLQRVREEVSAWAESDVGAELSVLQSQFEADRRKLEAAETAIGEQLALARSMQAEASQIRGRLVAAETALADLATQELNARSELDIAEVDYLLRLANERLKLFADPVAADEALEVADMHLAAMDDPMYLTVRQDIATARRSLATVDIPDYLQIASDLDAIQERVAGLSFPGEEPPAAASDAVEDEGWWAKLKGVFSGLVTVRRSTDRENQRISLEDKDFIRQRIWLQLEVAHLSLMRRDEPGFRKSLDRVERSLDDWFDTSDSGYQAVMQGISDLKALQIRVDMPDISAPWSTLRMLRDSRVKPAPAPQSVQDNLQ